MNLLKKILRSKPFIISAAVLVFYTLAGFFLAPWLVRHYVPKIVQDQLKKQASIGDVAINPYIFTVEANDFRMDEPDGQPIQCDRSGRRTGRCSLGIAGGSWSADQRRGGGGEPHTDRARGCGCSSRAGRT